MHEVLVLRTAEADLEDIATYTKEQWGLAQARRYLKALQQDITALAEFPAMNPIYKSRHGHFHRATSGEHRIFYQIHESAVVIVRVLHGRMDMDSKFS